MILVKFMVGTFVVYCGVLICKFNHEVIATSMSDLICISQIWNFLWLQIYNEKVCKISIFAFYMKSVSKYFIKGFVVKFIRNVLAQSQKCKTFCKTPNL